MREIEYGILCWRKIAMMKRITITTIFLCIMISPVAAFGILQGDIYNSEKIDLKDAIVALCGQGCAKTRLSLN